MKPISTHWAAQATIVALKEAGVITEEQFLKVAESLDDPNMGEMTWEEWLEYKNYPNASKDN